MTVPVLTAGATPARATGGLVLVHGRGARAEDILDFGQALGLPDLALAAPAAPGNSWWPVSFLAPHDTLAPFIDAGLAAVEQAIETLAGQGVPRDRIAIGGFSQGGCLALEYAARRGGVRAAFGLSGALVGTGDAGTGPVPELYGHGDKLFDYDTDLSGLPVVLDLHENDPHIPLSRARRTAEVFESLGADVRMNVMPGPGHAIGRFGVSEIRGILNAA
ncbi:phospholipase [Rhodobacterales bacterium HKCCE2091]|nr:phospholipase [Rhodobacterales bacterium HKCCE2091]